MVDRANDPVRMGWLDGLRGVAALQVVLFHYSQAFLPGIGLLNQSLVHYQWERFFINTALFLPFDGFTALCIFFVLSGVALTCSFGTRPLAIPTNIMRRVIRLGLPMTSAILCGGVLFTLVPNAHIAAALLTGSEGWLGLTGPDPVSPKLVVHQIALEGLFAGYERFSVLPASVRAFLGLIPQTKSYDPPLWTLHVEFVGSLLVLLLVALRQTVGARIHSVICLLLTAVFSASFLGLFVVGHLAAGWLKRPASRRSNSTAGITLVGLGIIACTTYLPWMFSPLIGLLPTPLIGPPVDPWTQQKMIGAMGIFFGLAFLPGLQDILERPLLRWLGRISFSLYLTHFPLLFTLTSAGFILFAPEMSYGVAVCVATCAGIACSLGAATVFERWVDRPAIALSRRVHGLRE